MNSQQKVACLNPRCPSSSKSHYSGSKAHAECLQAMAGGKRKATPEDWRSQKVSLAPASPAFQQGLPLEEVPVSDEATPTLWSNLRVGDRVDMEPLMRKYDEDFDDSHIWNFEMAEIYSIERDRSYSTVTLEFEDGSSFALPDSEPIPRYSFLANVPREDDQEFVARHLASFSQGNVGPSPDWDSLEEGKKSFYLKDSEYILRAVGANREFVYENDIEPIAEGLLETKVDAGEIDYPVSQSDLGEVTDYVVTALAAIGTIERTGETPVLPSPKGKRSETSGLSMVSQTSLPLYSKASDLERKK